MTKLLLNVGASVFYLFMVMVIFVAAQLLGDILGVLCFDRTFLGYEVICNLVYIVSGVTLALLFAKYAMKISAKDMGFTAKFPGFGWIIIGLALPLAVTAFYLIFADGEIVKDTTHVSAVLFETFIDASIVTAIVEELLFRGLLMRAFMKKWSVAAAMLVPSLLFAFIHIIMMPTVSLPSFLMLLVGGTAVGVMLSIIAFCSGNLWASIIVHGLWNMVIIGGLFTVQASGSGVVDNFIFKYTLTSNDLLFAGGNYGIEVGLPAIIGFVAVSLLTLVLHKRALDIK